MTLSARPAPANAVTFSRRNVFKRDHTTCQYCGGRPGTEELTLDHVLPRSQGGQSWKLRAGLRGVQQAEGQPHARPGQHEAPPPARPARLETALRATTACGSQAGPSFLSEAYWNVELQK